MFNDPIYYEVRRMLNKLFGNGSEAVGVGAASVAALGGCRAAVALADGSVPDASGSNIATTVASIVAVLIAAWNVWDRRRRDKKRETKEDETAAITTWREIVERLDNDVKTLKTDREEQRKALDDCHAAHGRSEEMRRQMEAQNLALAARVAALETRGQS